ncbi:MAG: cobalt-precorrin-5B (C(1))-methyltransferase [Richelia sp.]|nr:cobalt-precorrin-5B (C(1))-methyltransferase [Richelia sp.]
MARTGYTLPVFAVAAAKAALIHLQQTTHNPSSVPLDLLPDTADILIEQVAIIDSVTALAFAISDPGDNLDITRNTPIWAWVKLSTRQDESQPLIIEAGEGVGKTAVGEPAIYSYARRLFATNLSPLIPEDKTATVRIILPEGRQLAQRTSNEAFGVLEGLSLLGTSGISRPLSAKGHLKELRTNLQEKVKSHPHLAFCLGSNGYSVAQRLGIPEDVIVQTGNWLGALLVEAGLYKTESVLLLGYQGKLIKLAGGIFNTSSHLANGKLEIIAAAVAEVGDDINAVRAVLQSQTADGAYKLLVEMGLVSSVFDYLSEKIRKNSEKYVKKYADIHLDIGVMLFDRKGKIISQDERAKEIREYLSYV